MSNRKLVKKTTVKPKHEADLSLYTDMKSSLRYNIKWEKSKLQGNNLSWLPFEQKIEAKVRPYIWWLHNFSLEGHFRNW